MAKPAAGDDGDQEHQAPIHFQQLVGDAQGALGRGIGASVISEPPL